MDNPLKYVEQLAECAAQEELPRGHVLPQALARLREMRTPPLVRPWGVFAAGALAFAAIAVVSIVSYDGNVTPDPILVFFKVASLNL
jgi:hypothetical protein